jgi:hypothetical protein
MKIMLLAHNVQGGSNMTGTDLCVNKSQFVPVIFKPPCIYVLHMILRINCSYFVKEY